MLKILDNSTTGVKWLYDTKLKTYIVENADGERRTIEDPFEARTAYIDTLDAAWYRRMSAKLKGAG